MAAEECGLALLSMEFPISLDILGDIEASNEVDGIAKEIKERSAGCHPFRLCSMRRRLLNIIRRLLVSKFARIYDDVTK
jgi:hypothetical protein